MVSSPMYERLKVFMEAARSNRDLDAWDTDHKKTLQGFEEAAERLKRYSDTQGFQGQTADAMSQWVAESLQRISMVRSIYTAGHSSYEAGRSTMATALKEAEMISPTLLDSATEAMRDNPVVMVPRSSPGGGIPVLSKRFTTGAAYVDAVEAQANAQREAAAQRVLSMVNQRTSHIAALMRQQTQLSKQVTQHSNDTDTVGSNVAKAASALFYSEDQGFGRANDRSPSSPNYPGGFAQPWWSEADAAAAQNRTVASGAIPTQEPAYGELGSRTNPITDPQELMGTDLLHTPANGTAYRNGVVGGHTPAPPADAHHPLWRLNGGAASDSATAGRLGGAGVLGAGALGLRGAARMGSGSIGGSGSLGGSSVFGRFGGAGSSALGRFGGSGSAGGMSGAGRMGAAGMRGVTGSTNGMGASGAAGLKVGSYSGSGFGSYTPPAGSAGAAGAGGANGAAGSSGVAGTTGANGGGTAGAAGAAGKGGTTNGGFMGSGAGAGAGAGKDDKKGRKNRYVAFKFDDDEDELPAGYVNPLSQTSGTDKDIAPAKRTDDGWDPRQW